MNAKNFWWLMETLVFTGLLAAIWQLDSRHFWSAIVISTIFAFCYRKRVEAQSISKPTSVFDFTPPTPERMAWLKSCGEASKAAEERGKSRNDKFSGQQTRCRHDVWLADHCFACEAEQNAREEEQNRG
jgi:hypothetical protein